MRGAHVGCKPAKASDVIRLAHTRRRDSNSSYLSDQLTRASCIRLAASLSIVSIIMPRLGFTLMSVLALVAAQETRITDPAAAASVENAQLYELIKAEYLAAGCEDAGWGPFPNVTSTPLSVEAYARAHGTSGCKCGMLYGLAHSSVQRENDVAAMSSTAQAQGPTPCSGGSCHRGFRRGRSLRYLSER